MLKKELDKEKFNAQRLTKEIKLIKEEANRIIKDKDQEIKDKDQEIKDLQMNLRLLKETISVAKSHDKTEMTENEKHPNIESELDHETEIDNREETANSMQVTKSAVNEYQSTDAVQTTVQDTPRRRSGRITGEKLKKQKEDLIKLKMTETDDSKHGLEIDKVIGEKGSGIRVCSLQIFIYNNIFLAQASRVFSKGEFVVEYTGDLVSRDVALQREVEYSMDREKGSYMFYVDHGSQRYW